MSNIGKITLPGNALQVYSTTNVKNETVNPDGDSNIMDNNTGGLTPGYGLFAFSHDFNMQGLETGDSNPNELETEFICINDGAHIDIWDSCHNTAGDNLWIQSAIKMGSVHLNNNGNKVKPVYYMTAGGLRVCDANFGQITLTGAMNEAIDDNALVGSEVTLTIDGTYSSALSIGEYIKIDSEIMKITNISGNNLTVVRGQFGTTAAAHANSNADIIKINVPKILTHINRPLLEKAEGSSSANTTINRWVKDIQCPEPPLPDALTVYQHNIIGYDTANKKIRTETLHPNSPEKVFLSIASSEDDIDTQYTLEIGTAVGNSSGSGEEQIVELTIVKDVNGTTTDVNLVEEGFSQGKLIVISGASVSHYNGIWEIVGFGDEINELRILCEFQAYTPADDDSATITLHDEVMEDALKNEYIFGMSYLYEGSGDELQESTVTVGQKAGTGDEPVGNFDGMIPYDRARFESNNGWLTADSSLNTDTFNTTESDSWDWFPTVNMAKGNSANNEYLIYRDTSNPIVAGDLYDVFIHAQVDSGNIVVSIGESSSSSGGTTKTITETGTHNFRIQARTTNADLSEVLVIKGISGFQGRIIQVSVVKTSYASLSSTNTIDLRQYFKAALGQMTFLCNNSRSGSTQNNSWNERIEGFRIYMKQVDMFGEGLSEEWLLAYHVNLKDGTYICHAKDGSEEHLQLADYQSGTDWTHDSSTDSESLVTSNILGDSIKSLPLLTYESENGYQAHTNLAAMYKTSTIIERSVFIGNLKIGERTFPDRMIRTDIDRPDTFPSDGTHSIDVATDDGDSIVKLESLGNKLIQYKKKVSYLLTVTAEDIELTDIWTGAGILSPSQVTKTKDGIIWVNDNGLFFYNGEELKRVTEDRFKSDNWSINENEDTPVLIGYDEKSNKVIIQTLNTTETAHGGFIYDLSTGAITQSEGGFNWYMTGTHELDTESNNPKIGPPISVVPGKGPIT